MSRREEILPADQCVMPAHGIVRLTELVEQVRSTHGSKLRVPSDKTGVLAPRIEIFKIAELGLDTGYQRKPNKAHIIRIANDFDEKAAGIPLVARMHHRGGKLRPVLDAQQRLIAAALRGYTEAACIVIDIHSYAEEARIFRRLNIDRRAVPTAVIHNSDLIRGADYAQKLQKTLNRVGFEISENSGYKRIKGPNRLHDAASYYSYEAIGEGLLLYDAIWPDHDMVQVYVVAGLTLLCHAYGPNALEKELNAVQIGNRVRRSFLTARSAMNYKDPGTNTGRPAEAYRLESDLHFARIIVNAYMKHSGVWPKRLKVLDMERVRAASDRCRRQQAEAGAPETLAPEIISTVSTPQRPTHQTH